MMSKPPPFDPAAARQRLQAAAPSARPAEGPRAAADHLLLSPDEIVLEGPYVRRHVDEAELDSLRKAIEAGGEIKQAIGVRTEGPPLDPRYVLVYGMRRWLASRAAGLERIPVRNHGRISAEEALALQVTENEARIDPHPVDTAVSYHLLVSDAGMTQSQVARIAGRSAGHVSYMRAVGEAILLLGEGEREALYAIPEVTVPRFQRIAPLKTVEERVAALRELISDQKRDTGSTDPRAPTVFRAGPARGDGAWSVRVSYRDEDLRRDAELAARLEKFLEEQLERLRERTRPAGDPSPRRPVMWEMDSP